jgi:hypothetical protein
LVGIEEHASVLSSNITVVPNPNNGLFHLLFTLPKEENLNVKVSNALGQEISAVKLEGVTNTMIDMDLHDKPDGIYFVEISNGTERITKKIVIGK